VSGICKDLLENSSFLPNMQLIIGIDMPLVFGDDDDYFTFLRTYKKTNFQKLTQEINELLEPRYEHLADFLGVIMSFKVTNIHDYSKVFDIKATIMAFLLLLITGLNFALLSISSLVSRAKEVGVRKASGARTSGIFSLIIWETAIYVLMAALLSCALFWGLKPEIEEMFGNYENLFAFENIWAVGVVFVALIVFAGVIPAWIFSQIPVTQIFQRFTTNRILWKRILLFIQFMVSIFVISVMFIALRQYQATINYRYGYEPEKLIWMRIDSHTETQLQSFLSDIETDSRIEALNLSSMSVWYGFSGDHVSRKPNAADPLFIKSLSTDSNFFSTHGIKILQGNSDLTANWRTGGNVVVNEALLHFFNIEGNPLGEVLYSGSIPFTIVGVCQNFESLHVAEGVKPLMVLARDTNNTRYLTIRVNEVTADVVKMIREKVKQHDPNTIVPEVNTCSDTIYWYFHRLLLDGKITVFASICLLLITIMGILGYVNIELRHRTKEIAIRKIHGSTAGAIIWKLTRELLFIALLTVPVAIPFAYMFGIRWQRDFLVKAELSWYLFACAILIIVLTIVICAVIQTWRAANANPARAIKKE
jgi:putative ABC transport system permease protein